MAKKYSQLNLIMILLVLIQIFHCWVINKNIQIMKCLFSKIFQGGSPCLYGSSLFKFESFIRIFLKWHSGKLRTNKKNWNHKRQKIRNWNKIGRATPRRDMNKTIFYQINGFSKCNDLLLNIKFNAQAFRWISIFRARPWKSFHEK